jgi:hypothetical protein
MLQKNCGMPRAAAEGAGFCRLDQVFFQYRIGIVLNHYFISTLRRTDASR